MASVTLRAHKNFVIHATSDTAVGEEIDLREAYQAILTFISEQLNHFLSLAVPANSDDAVPPEMSYLFYVSAIFLTMFPRRTSSDDSFGNAVNIVLQTMRLYKEKIPGVNKFLEGQFAGRDFDIQTSRYVVRFSKEWWSFLDDDLPTRPGTPSTQEGLQPQLTAVEMSDLHTGPHPALPTIS
ncbi:hypothetical protein GALMADRAFT_147823 [Galerina marginata CBS 339.88]|uniref:Uncharacterized protein n=1 Tax=Galerina marginata (strain CBS 339.88) TaxID=685588 RepID=A0A067SIM1_GALM3|nr:hypothetical protein GALMADRAFT_147823 [Galerina marginata CBS 339.88]